MRPAARRLQALVGMFRRYRDFAAGAVDRITKASWHRHLAPISFGGVVLFLMVWVDAFEQFMAFNERHREWQLDEVFTTFAVFGVVSI
jgi:hypothetical protein